MPSHKTTEDQGYLLCTLVYSISYTSAYHTQHMYTILKLVQFKSQPYIFD